MSWKVFATRLNGDGTEDMLIEDLPLADVTTTRRLNGADSVSGAISPEILGLKDENGDPVVKPWSTAVYAEHGGRIVGGIVQEGTPAQGATLGVDAAGFSFYPKDMPYDGETYFVETDALDIMRHIWDHLQSQEGGNLGLQLDQMKSGVLIGEELEEVTFTTGEGEDVAFEAGPFKLAWHLTDDLGERVEELVDTGGFEYREEHYWNETEDRLIHRLRFGVPLLGRRRQDIHFLAGDNLVTEPSFAVGQYASEVWALGAGEGRLMKMGRASRSGEARLRRVAVASDKSLTSNKRSRELAAKALSLATGEPEVNSIDIRADSDMPDLGDEVLLKTNGVGWHGQKKIWVRVLAITERMGSSVATCEVVRVP